MSLLSAVLKEVDKVSTEDLKKRREKILPKIKDLTERVQLLSFALHQNFVDIYVNFTPTKSLEQINYKNRKANIISDYQKVSEEVKTFREKVCESDEEFYTCWMKFTNIYDSLTKLCIVAEGKNILDHANQEFSRYNYKEAMLTVKDLQDQLKILKFEGNASKALSNITAQAENQFALYSAHVSTEWEDIFSWEEKKGVSCLTYSLSVQQSDSILIQKVLKTLHATDRLNAELGLFSHFFIEQVLHNVIRHNCDIFTEDHIGAIIFNIKIDLNESKKPNYQTIFNNLTAIFEFLHSTLGSQFDNGKKFIEVFAESIREKFFHKIIEDCIRTNLPSCDSSYENYKNIVVEIDSFNKFLIELKFVDAEESPLNKYVNDTECVLYNKKCDKLLSDIRNLLNESLSSGTIVVGTVTEINETVIEDEKEALWDVNKPLFLPRCVISQNVKRIMMMIVEYLEESAKLPEKYSKQLVAYIRDIAIMYQCVVPKKFKLNLECCPLDIALFFNNCFYLAHGLVGPPWKSILPITLADQLTTALLESIQDLRVLGLEKVSLYLQNQKNSIIQSIEAKAKDSSPWTHEIYEQFDTAINKAISLMRDLKSSWIKILPARMYEMSLCTLIQALCQAILDRIFVDSRPIDEELVYVLAVRLEDIVSEIEVLFEDPIELEDKINVWTKFTKMPQLLKVQLLEIAELWNKNRDQLQSYTCEEIRQIVKLRFPDDKYRLKILKEIQ